MDNEDRTNCYFLTQTLTQAKMCSHIVHPWFQKVDVLLNTFLIESLAYFT